MITILSVSKNAPQQNLVISFHKNASKFVHLILLPVLLLRFVRLSVHNSNIDSTQHAPVKNYVLHIYLQTTTFITAPHFALEIILLIGSKNCAQILAQQATMDISATTLVCRTVQVAFMLILYSKNAKLIVFKQVITEKILQMPAF